MADPALQIAALTKRFGTLTAVDAIDLTVAQGEFVTLLGPSGCGKTTTLNMIAGFVPPDAGSIRLQGRPVESLPPFRRDLGLVFQDYALFPHMTAAENVGFGLRMRRLPREETVRRVRNGEWQMQIDAETWQRLQKVWPHGETISDCIIRVIIVSQHRRGL